MANRTQTTNQPNLLLFRIVVSLVTILASGIAIWWILSDAGTKEVTFLSRTFGRFDLAWQSDLLNVHLPLWLMATFITAVIAFLIARYRQWPILSWLDRQMLPRTKIIIDGQEEKRETTIKRVAKALNPDSNAMPPSLPKLAFGMFQTEDGEGVLAPPFFKNWWAITVWQTFWTTVIMTLLITPLTLGFVMTGLVSYETGLILQIFLMAFTVILRYWSREWVRYGNFFVVSRGRTIEGTVGFSWLGFLFRRGTDPEIRMTSVQYITDADADPVPKKWGIKVGFFKELLLEFLGNTEEHVGYVRFIGVSEKLGSELLESYTQAPTIASLVNVARTSMPTVRNELRELESDKKRHIRGKPDDKTPRDRREQEAKTWYQDERKRLGYPGPQVLNVFDLRAAQLQNISGGKYSGPQFPSSRHTPPGTPAPSDTGVSVALGSRQTRRNNPAPSQPFESYIGRLTQESIDTLRNNGFGYQRLHGVFQGFGVTPQEILDRLEKGESTDQIMRSFR